MIRVPLQIDRRQAHGPNPGPEPRRVPEALRRSATLRTAARPRFICTLGLLLIAGLAALVLWLPRLGGWLVIQEPLQTADAIVVLGGNLPFRSQEAASLYRQGWANRVWITAPEGPAELDAIRNLGLSSVSGQELSHRVLEHFGVPTKAIRTLSAETMNTAHEMELVAHELRIAGGHRVILVTSKAHTRRVRATWNALADPGQQCVVRHIDRDVFNANQWWKSDRDRQIVTHEMGGLVYLWCLHPIRMLENVAVIPNLLDR